MNNVRSIASLNEHELKLALDGSTRGSWHDEYKDSAVVFIGGLDPGLTEGDVVTIFSQYGEILDINLPKWTTASIASQQRRNAPGADASGQGDLDAEERRRQRDAQEAKQKVGKRRGFGFLLYQDQRSTVLAVDNLNGAQVLGKTLRVDHVKDYKQLEKDTDTGKMREAEERTLNARPQLVGGDEEEEDKDKTEQDELDMEDPMAAYIAKNKARGPGDEDDLDWLLHGDFTPGSSRQPEPSRLSGSKHDSTSGRRQRHRADQSSYDDQQEACRDRAHSHRYDDDDDDDRDRRSDRTRSRRYAHEDDRESDHPRSRKKHDSDRSDRRSRDQRGSRTYDDDDDRDRRSDRTTSRRYYDDRNRASRYAAGDDYEPRREGTRDRSERRQGYRGST